MWKVLAAWCALVVQSVRDTDGDSHLSEGHLSGGCGREGEKLNFDLFNRLVGKAKKQGGQIQAETTLTWFPPVTFDDVEVMGKPQALDPASCYQPWMVGIADKTPTQYLQFIPQDFTPAQTWCTEPQDRGQDLYGFIMSDTYMDLPYASLANERALKFWLSILDWKTPGDLDIQELNDHFLIAPTAKTRLRRWIEEEANIDRRILKLEKNAKGDHPNGGQKAGFQVHMQSRAKAVLQQLKAEKDAKWAVVVAELQVNFESDVLQFYNEHPMVAVWSGSVELVKVRPRLKDAICKENERCAISGGDSSARVVECVPLNRGGATGEP